MAGTHYQLTSRMLLLCVAALGVAGCETFPNHSEPSAEPGRESVESGHGSAASDPSEGATRALLGQSRAEQAAGDYARAAASLERALRIRPDDPRLWLELARIRMAERDYPQAESLASKALTLAGGDPGIERAASELIDQAARSR